VLPAAVRSSALSQTVTTAVRIRCPMVASSLARCAIDLRGVARRGPNLACLPITLQVADQRGNSFMLRQTAASGRRAPRSYMRCARLTESAVEQNRLGNPRGPLPSGRRARGALRRQIGSDCSEQHWKQLRAPRRRACSNSCCGRLRRSSDSANGLDPARFDERLAGEPSKRFRLASAKKPSTGSTPSACSLPLDGGRRDNAAVRRPSSLLPVEDSLDETSRVHLDLWLIVPSPGSDSGGSRAIRFNNPPHPSGESICGCQSSILLLARGDEAILPSHPARPQRHGVPMIRAAPLSECAARMLPQVVSGSWLRSTAGYPRHTCTCAV